MEIRPGDQLKPGRRVFVFANLETQIIETDVLEEFLGDVKVGSEVKMILLADRNRTYYGKVESITDAAIIRNNETVEPVRVSIANGDDFLRPNFNIDLYSDVP